MEILVTWVGVFVGFKTELNLLNGKYVYIQKLNRSKSPHVTQCDRIKTYYYMKG